MKLFLLALTVSLVSQASTLREYDLSKALDAEQVADLSRDIPHFYNLLKECEEEVQVSFGKARVLKHLQYSDTRNGHGFLVKGAGSYPQPSTRKFTVELNISARLLPAGEPVARDRRRAYEVTCEIERKE